MRNQNNPKATIKGLIKNNAAAIIAAAIAALWILAELALFDKFNYLDNRRERYIARLAAQKGEGVEKE